MVQMGMTYYPKTLETSASPMDSQNPNKTRQQGPRQHHQRQPPIRRTNNRT